MKKEEGRTIGAMKEIAEWLQLPELTRGEAYDISNISGFESVGSMVVYEHQSSIDQEMVIRCGNYEMVEYLKQLKNKKLKRLVPQVMIVFYTGDKKWNAPVKLSDYLDVPKELKAYVNEWIFIFIDVKGIDTSKIKDAQTRYFIEAIQNMYKGNYDKLHRKIKMNRNNFIYAAIITGSLDLIKDLPEGDEIDMCEGMERMAEGFRSEGKLEEKRNTLKEQLVIKLGAVSSRLEE